MPQFVWPISAIARTPPTRDGVADLELGVPQVRPARADDEGEVLGDLQVLAAIHAHADQQPGGRVRVEGPSRLWYSNRSAIGVPRYGAGMSAAESTAVRFMYAAE